MVQNIFSVLQRMRQPQSLVPVPPQPSLPQRDSTLQIQVKQLRIEKDELLEVIKGGKTREALSKECIIVR